MIILEHELEGSILDIGGGVRHDAAVIWNTSNSD